MTRLKGKQIAADMHIIVPRAEFSDRGSASVSGIAVPGIPPLPDYANTLSGGNGGDAGNIFPVPELYYVQQLDEKWAFGVGIYAPFGLSTEYEPGWVGRYYGIRSKLRTVNVNPSVAYKVNNAFSYGFGISVQYLEAEISNAVDFGTLDALGYFDTNLGDGRKDPVLGLTPQGDDGFTSSKGSSWGYGFNLGILYAMNNDSRLGLAYRSGTSHHVKGNVSWNTPETNGFDLAMAAAEMFQNGSMKADVDLPGSASLSFFHDMDEKFSIMADITWTDWSVVDELVLKYGDKTSNGVTTFSWEDTLRYSIGAAYTYNDTYKLRCGLAYDETPIPDKEHREVRIPGEDRLWFTAGSSIMFSDNLYIDMAYAYIMTPDAPEIDKSSLTASSEHLTKGLLSGEYDAYVNIFSLQVNYKY